MPQQIMVRRYKNSSQFEKDANRQYDRGYEIAEVNGQRPNVAILKTTIHTAMTGLVGLAIGGRAHKNDPILVTYRFSGVIPEKASNPSRRERMGQPAQLIVLTLIIIVFVGLAVAVVH